MGILASDRRWHFTDALYGWSTSQSAGTSSKQSWPSRPGIIAGSVALIGFGVDSAIEVITAVGLLWRLRKAGPHAPVTEESEAKRRALYVVAATFFLVAAYIGYDAVSALIQREEPLTSPAGIVLAALSLAIMPVLAYAKHRTGREMGSRALVADAKETWVCSYLSLALLVGVGAFRS
jgi:divalent metal cation (Fe/Co/Zn/Cd) transporter